MFVCARVCACVFVCGVDGMIRMHVQHGLSRAEEKIVSLTHQLHECEKRREAQVRPAHTPFSGSIKALAGSIKALIGSIKALIGSIKALIGSLRLY